MKQQPGESGVAGPLKLWLFWIAPLAGALLAGGRPSSACQRNQRRRTSGRTGFGADCYALAISLGASGAAHSGEPLAHRSSLLESQEAMPRTREALPLIYYYRSPVSQRLTAMCGAGGAKWHLSLGHIKLQRRARAPLSNGERANTLSNLTVLRPLLPSLELTPNPFARAARQTQFLLRRWKSRHETDPILATPYYLHYFIGVPVGSVGPDRQGHRALSPANIHSTGQRHLAARLQSAERSPDGHLSAAGRNVGQPETSRGNGGSLLHEEKCRETRVGHNQAGKRHLGGSAGASGKVQHRESHRDKFSNPIEGTSPGDRHRNRKADPRRRTDHFTRSRPGPD